MLIYKCKLRFFALSRLVLPSLATFLNTLLTDQDGWPQETTVFTRHHKRKCPTIAGHFLMFTALNLKPYRVLFFLFAFDDTFDTQASCGYRNYDSYYKNTDWY
jgi:hypothetical protein